MRYIITGASKGIGKQAAISLLEKGNECLLVARSEEELKQICAKYNHARFFAMDLSDSSKIEQLYEENKDWYPFDGIVHCAGVAPLKQVEENTIELVQQTYNVNVFSFIEFMRCFVEKNAFSDGASVVVMSSVVAQRGSNRQAIYSGTKAALDATVRSMAREIVYKGIRINSIASGTVETEMLEALRQQSDNLDEKIKAHSPLGVVPVEEVVSMIEYLLSKKSEHITGTTVALDAGYLL